MILCIRQVWNVSRGRCIGCEVVHFDPCSAVVSSNVLPHHLCVLLTAAVNGCVIQCHYSSFPIIMSCRYGLHTAASHITPYKVSLHAHNDWRSMKRRKFSPRKERTDKAKCLRLAPSHKLCDDGAGEGKVGKKKRKWIWPWATVVFYEGAH